MNGRGHSPGMVSSEKANGLAAPGRDSVIRTAFTPVRGTLARRVMAPSAPVVTDAWCRVASLAAFRNRRSTRVLLGSSNPVTCRVPQLTRARSAWRWSGWAAAGPAPSSPSTMTAPATAETLSQRICIPSDGIRYRLRNRWRTTSSMSR